jgi:hypothetical protein
VNPHNSQHYHLTVVEPFDIWDAWDLGDYRKQAVKYIHRAAFKGQWVDDMLKARDYLLIAADRDPNFRVFDRSHEESVPEHLRFAQVVVDWRLDTRRAEALGALWFARSPLDLKVAASYCEAAAREPRDE